MRPDRTREGVLSHPSAGDISIPNEGSWARGRAPRRGLILPQAGPYPPTIIPLTHARSCRESGDYAGEFRLVYSFLNYIKLFFFRFGYSKFKLKAVII